MKRLLLASLLVLPAMAQEAPDKPREPEPADVMHEVRLRSGTLLVGKVEPRQWRVLTKFGTLHVPAENIRHVVFGRKAQPERFAQVRALIADLRIFIVSLFRIPFIMSGISLSLPQSPPPITLPALQDARDIPCLSCSLKLKNEFLKDAVINSEQALLLL